MFFRTVKRHKVAGTFAITSYLVIAFVWVLAITRQLQNMNFFVGVLIFAAAIVSFFTTVYLAKRSVAENFKKHG